MLVETALRVSGEEFGAPIVICNNEHRFIIAEQLQQSNVKARSIVLEPVGRSTAPAAAVAALMLADADPDSLMLMMPSDHLVQQPDNFITACLQARQAADQHALVTFGTAPHGSISDFGYILKGAPYEACDGSFHIERFVEKPDRATAERYVESGGYLWNSGILLFRAQDYLDELTALCPEMVCLCRQALELGQDDMDFFRLDVDSFAAIEGDSIDYAVMEKTKNAVVFPVEMGWNDVGSWSALWDVGEKNQDGNVVIGEVMTRGVHNSYLRSSGQLLATIGVEDCIVVATDDVVLVANKDCAQDVKEIVDSLRNDGRDEHMTHRRVYRPWGWYQAMDTTDHYQVKQLLIKPGGILSLQSHQHRSEHWVVVSGIATVMRDDDDITLEVNQSVYIPAGVKHRLENKGALPLCIIEVQTGSYLGEDDITRFEDIYGRL